MDTGAHGYRLVVAILATWRVSHLLHAEDGPWDLVFYLRRRAGDAFFGALLDCFYCLSLWVAAPFAVAAGSTWLERAWLWLAISGGACLLERMKPAVPAAIYVEDKEPNDVLLRQQESPRVHEPPARFSPAQPSHPDGRGPT